MKTISAGHKYKLSNLDDPQTTQQLLFIRKQKQAGTAKLALVHDGTTNEEVIKVLINRIGYLDKKMPHKKNKSALNYLNRALKALEGRKKDRDKRGVTGTSKK